MKRLSDILVILLKRVSIKSLIENEIQSIQMPKSMLEEIFLPYMSNCSDTEIRHYIAAVEDKQRGYEEFSGDFVCESMNVFNIILLLQKICWLNRKMRWCVGMKKCFNGGR